MKRMRTLLILLACLSAGASFAKPTPHMQLDECSSVGYLNAGADLTDEEIAALAVLAETYPLQMVFAEESGNPLSDVDVLIEDATSAKLVDAKGQGPLFFAAVPPGRYRVAVTSDGKTLSHTIFIDDGDTIKINFYWP